MKSPMLFPGQASQYVGMGKDYYDRFPEARELYRQANQTLGFDITELSFSGDLEELTKTHNAQPAILLHSIVVLTVLEGQGIRPSIVAGHSLGEFSALVAAGFFKPLDALLIVRRRGELMFESGLERPGTMAAVIGLEVTGLTEAVAEASVDGIVVIANYNSPSQFSISGEVEAVDKAMALAKDKGAKRVMKLQVSGAFHSPLMEPTISPLRKYLEKFRHGHLTVPWVANVTGKVVEDDDQVLDLLSRQLSSPVRWVDSMRLLADRAEGPVLEVGPGKVLAGLMKRIDEAIPVHPLTDVGSFAAVLEGSE
ncbi:MAG: ACP S-malonyltransferase [Candidatus Latescibacteria bacterium]|nr:ACP S-malonyltransferase [Candidatus Latescibacterota bacterium]NIM20979.1 ACP S-malonyltransferase [Candidatus Latescibacterota bacterium]NIM65114.1 ACP S-malonyltransferase [Candidatus Latescibacterota bacterium]NIO01629.1 ACP S-malonyltransferase [Candidatus Latescibacterota bacterium]NIO28146.1 ACP S-malonyltransferase [Candidatus Latescibacterota bacterium]